jgi:hypothetical protein
MRAAREAAKSWGDARDPQLRARASSFQGSEVDVDIRCPSVIPRAHTHRLCTHAQLGCTHASETLRPGNRVHETGGELCEPGCIPLPAASSRMLSACDIAISIASSSSMHPRVHAHGTLNQGSGAGDPALDRRRR